MLLEGNPDRTVPWSMLWNNCLLKFVSLLGRFGGRKRMMENLKRRGFQMASRCPLCGKADEDLHYLLIHCPSDWGMWESLISIPGLNWVCPLLAKDLILGWSCFSIKKRARKLWRAIPFCLFWVIWKERNWIIFEDVPFSLSRLKTSFASMLVSWAGCIEVKECFSIRILLCIL